MGKWTRDISLLPKSEPEMKEMERIQSFYERGWIAGDAPAWWEGIRSGPLSTFWQRSYWRSGFVTRLRLVRSLSKGLVIGNLRQFIAAMTFGHLRRFAILSLVLSLPPYARPAASAEAPSTELWPISRILPYLSSGTYLQEIAAVADEARKSIETRAAARKPGERLVVILDVDETTLSSLPTLTQFRTVRWPTEWTPFIAKGDLPPIGSMLELYQATRRAGVAVIFLTGRSEPYREITEANLKRAGYTGYERYVGRPLNSSGTYARFKASIRQSLIAEGWTIIANLGDQGSDVAGGHAEKAFRLPNPFYARE